MRTLDEVQKIVSDLDREPLEIHSILSEMSTDDIVSKLLNRPVSEKENEDTNQNDVGLDYYRSLQNDVRLDYYRSLQSHRKIIGRLLIFFRRVVRRLLGYLIIPIVEKQNTINAQTTALLESVSKELHRLDKKVIDSEIMIESNMAKIESNAAKIEKQNTINAQTTALLESVSKEFHRLDKKVIDSEIMIESNMAKIESNAAEINEYKKSHAKKHDDFELSMFRALNKEGKITPIIKKAKTSENIEELDYFDFENEFRGTRDNVKKSLEFYMQFLQGKRKVVDLGCGRGEMLELLQESRIDAIGIDISQEFVDYCNFRGLEALCGDATEYLESLDEGSVDAITGIQLAEHLNTDKLLQLCSLAYQKIPSGGVLIIETPNPTSLAIYTNAFYVDPTHTKPIHPHYLRYITEKAGFSKVDTVFTESSKPGYRLPLLDAPAENLSAFNDGINLLSDVFFGSQDYAIVAIK